MRENHVIRSWLSFSASQVWLCENCNLVRNLSCWSESTPHPIDEMGHRYLFSGARISIQLASLILSHYHCVNFMIRTNSMVSALERPCDQQNCDPLRMWIAISRSSSDGSSSEELGCASVRVCGCMWILSVWAWENSGDQGRRYRVAFAGMIVIRTKKAELRCDAMPRRW